jgi:peptidoglycan/xylan/chitin deacetylase (PgdA/CDA1 family)
MRTARSDPHAYGPNKGSVLALTFDLDGRTMWTSKDPQNADRPSVLSQADYELREGVDVILELLEEFGIATTFFVPTDVAAAWTGLVQRILGCGHEIALHGTDHQRLSERHREAEYMYLSQAADRLASITGVLPVGYRAPYFDVTPNTRSILAELGLRYSSNYMDSIHPYIVDGTDSRVVEIPVHHMLDDGGYLLVSHQPPNHRQYMTNRHINEIMQAEVEAITQRGGAATLTLHPQLIGRPSRLNLIRWLLEAVHDDSTISIPRLADLAVRITDRSNGD